MSNVEILGYVASCLLLLAMLMTSVVKLRIINTIGCILYIIYGLYINAYPVAIMNLAIACVNIVHLCRNRFSKNSFKILPIKNDDSLLKPFVEHNKADIESNFPEFTLDDRQYACSYMILRNMNIAGIFLANDAGDGNLFVVLDYVVAAYRDCKVGDFLFNTQQDMFKRQGFNKITTISGSNHHSKYLKKIGFKEIDSESGIKTFCLEL